MNKRIQILLILICSILSLSVTAGVGLMITAVDENGKMTRSAQLHLSQSGNNEESKTLDFDEKGQLFVELSNLNMWRLYFTAPDKKNVTTYLFPEENGDIKINVTLANYNYQDSIENFMLIDSRSKFSRRSAQKFTLGDNGIFVFETEVKEDIFEYQLYDADKGGHTINGVFQDSYKYDGGGDYISVVNVKDGKVKIFLDPKKIKPSTNPSTITIHNEIAAKRQQLLTEMSQWQDVWYGKLSQYKKEKGDVNGFKIDETEMVAKIDHVLKHSTDQLEKQVALMSSFKLKTKTERYASLAIQQIPVDSDLWSISGGNNVLGAILINDDPSLSGNYSKRFEIGIKKHQQFVLNFLAKGRSDSGKKQLLGDGVYFYTQLKNKSMARKFYNLLVKEYPEATQTKNAAFYIGDTKKVKVGTQVPEFEFSIINSTKQISDKNLKGKIYLIDFWATWCSPCLKEMPFLDKANEMFSKDEFEIISVSIDRTAEIVQSFQKKKWNMPWKNIWLNKDQYKSIRDTFEIKGIPKALLIGKDGTIIAMDADVKQDKLLEIIRTILSR